MFKINMLLFSALMMSVSAFAATKNSGTCNYPQGFNLGLNIKAYQQCIDKMNACPKVSGLFSNNDCLRKVIREEKACRQLDKLAHYINVSPDMITAQQKGNMTLIDVFFVADGGHLYYILSPNGCLISTNVDPRNINQNLNKQYAQANFYIDSHGEPTYSTQNGMQRFTAVIDAKKQCRACPVIATAEINFDFSKEGKWLKTTLGQFQTK